MTFLLALPAIVVTACFFVIWFGIEDVRGVSTGGIDYAGLVAITAVLGLVMGGLIAIRLQGIDSMLAWGLNIAGMLALIPFGRLGAAPPEPTVDGRNRGQPPQGPSTKAHSVGKDRVSN